MSGVSAPSEPAWPIALASWLVGGLSLAWVYAAGWNNLYGDGQAHLAIARKLVDMPSGSTGWERYIQLGSPWLPLPHVIAAPLTTSDHLWRTGLAGSFVSLASFVIAATFLFRLAAEVTQSRIAAVVGWLAFALNPSLLYVQTTPLTEPLFLAVLLGSAWYVHSWIRHRRRTLLAKAALWTLLSVLTRYEGWILLPVGFVVVLWQTPHRGWSRVLDTGLWVSIAGSGVVYWLWHNWAIYGRPLEFLDGFYSARGYFARHQDTLSYLSFVVGHPLYAGIVLGITIIICVTPVTTLLGLIGFGAALINVAQTRCQEVSTLVAPALLALPPLFTGYSLYSGNIQIYPLFLNNRYGLVALPVLALGVAVSTATLRRRFPTRRRELTFLMALLFLGQSAGLLWQGLYHLSVFQEAYRVQFAPIGRERRALAQFLKSQPVTSQVALFAGELSAVIAEGGLSYAQVVHEGSRDWHRLESSIPATVDWLVVGRGDALDVKLRQQPVGLEAFSTIWVSERGTFTVWRRKP